MKYQIAEFLIDTARYRISSGDAPIPAEPKVFDLLVYLIAAPGSGRDPGGAVPGSLGRP